MDLPDIELTESITGERIMPPESADEYTPTTADVAAAWRVASQYRGDYAEASAAGLAHVAEFDRWLAQHDAEVAAAALEGMAAGLMRPVAKLLYQRAREIRNPAPEPVDCPTCGGSGKVTGDRFIGVDCPQCLGDGAVEP